MERVQICKVNHRRYVKIGEETYSMEDLHRQKRISIQKYCFLAVILVGITVNYGIKERKELKALYE
jgi:hypothetical protein